MALEDKLDDLEKKIDGFLAASERAGEQKSSDTQEQASDNQEKKSGK